MRYYEKKARRQGFKVIAGVDEVGRGPLAGPVVASCIVLHKARFSALIRDSKMLSPKKRLFAYKEIIENSSFGIGIKDEKIIDRVNIYQATIMAMEEAVNNMGASADYILVDGVLKLAVPRPYLCIKGGDSKSITIAAASIIAKVTRDNIMLEYDKEYPEYGFSRHKGYGTPEHMKALRKFGPSPIHRKSFYPVCELC